MKAFVRATWLLNSRNLLPKAMDVRLEFADFPFLTGKALSDRMQGEEVFIAALDVQASEPLSRGSALLTLDNVIVFPHIASYTREAQAYCEDVIRFAIW